VNLYLKFNDFNSDPLGEDPETPRRRAATLAALDDGALVDRIPMLARRLDTINRQLTRDHGREVMLADVWGEKKVLLSEPDSIVLRAIDGVQTVRELSSASTATTLTAADTEAALRRLAQRGIIDLVSPALGGHMGGRAVGSS
jgi:hypothetical protein